MGRRRRGENDHAGEADAARVLVLHPVIKCEALAASAAASPLSHHEPIEQLTPEARLEEAVGLALAIQLEVRQSALVPLARPRPGALFGPGKVEELSGVIKAEGAGLVIVDHALTPVQQRNLEKAWNCKVLDRTGLILEIFGARARTKEGRLQVELAHLLYQRSRLVRSWTHLERQRGGYGFLGGPGERQIEADRRMIGERIDAIRRELTQVRRTRELHRESRRRVPFPAIALAGYTNAGKSSLFNALTEADVVAEDKLFATLDPTMRRIAVPSGRKAILSDTVGFISDLPTMLVAAFRATLEEVSQADLVLHVRDMAIPYSEQQKQDVEKILAELGVETQSDSKSIIEVWNKIDLLDEEQRLALKAKAARMPHPPVLVSAQTGEGLAELRQRIDDFIAANHSTQSLRLGAEEGALLHWLYEHGEICKRRDCESGAIELEVRMSSADFGRFEYLKAQHRTSDA